MGLKLMRRASETIIIFAGDDEIEVKIDSIKGKQVNLIVNAPKKINIARSELLERDEKIG